MAIWTANREYDPNDFLTTNKAEYPVEVVCEQLANHVPEVRELGPGMCLIISFLAENPFLYDDCFFLLGIY